MSRSTEREEYPRTISKDWTRFTAMLAEALSRLEPDHCLILNPKMGMRYLQFCCQGQWGMRVEVSSNHFLEGKERLSRKEMAWLRSNGWRRPTGTPRQATPARDPDGSPNYFIDFPASVPVAEIARVSIETLVHALAAPYPAALAYTALDASGQPRECEVVGLSPAADMTPTLAQAMLETMRSVTGLPDLSADEDGDVFVHYGSIAIGVLLLRNRVRLHAPLIGEVPHTQPLFDKLNRVNDGAHRLKVFWREDEVHAVLDVPTDPFIPEHLASAMQEFSEVADGLANVLRAEFSSQTAIDAADPLPCIH